MIAKLAIQHMLYIDARPIIEKKINELIDAYNNHYHETLDTHYNTTFPKQHTPEEE